MEIYLPEGRSAALFSCHSGLAEESMPCMGIVASTELRFLGRREMTRRLICCQSSKNTTLRRRCIRSMWPDLADHVSNTGFNLVSEILAEGLGVAFDFAKDLEGAVHEVKVV